MTAANRISKLLFNCFILLSFVVWGVSAVGAFGLVGHPFPGFRFEPTLTVSAVSDPTWSGTKAKLQQFDMLLRVDGHELKSPQDLTDYVRTKPVGTVLHYEMLREKKPIRADIATQPFQFGDWFKTFLPMLLVGLLHLIVGAIAFWVKPFNINARVHLLMTAATCWFCALASDYDSGRYLPQLYLLAVPFVGSAYLHLGMVFPETPFYLRKRPWMHALPYIPILLLVPIWEAVWRPVGALVNPGMLEMHENLQNVAVLWIMVGLLGLIGCIVYRRFKSTSALAKQQIKVALFGAAIAYLPGAIFWIVPYLANVNSLDSSGVLVNLSFACFVFFPISIAYAIVRHRMFDIDLVVKRTVVYATVVASLTGVYFLTIGLVRAVIDRFFGASGSDVGNMLATAVVALAFVPVRNWIQTLIDRVFYRNRYDFRTVVNEYSTYTKENPELEAVVDKYLDLINSTVHPRHMSIMVRDPKSRNLYVYKSSGLSIFPPDFAIKADTPEISELFSARRTGVRPSRATTRQLSHMDALGIELCVPLEIKGEILGMINVGQKLSELDYTAEDQGLLVNMGQQLASVIRIAEMTQAEVSRARLDAEIETARQIQASLLPAAVPAPAGLEVVGSSQSAYEFGGDYYDLVTLPDGQLRIAVGDVAGKGVQAAMVMAMAKSCFFNQVRIDPDLPKVMTAINSMIVETIDDKKHRKTSLIYGAIDPTAKVLRYTCAGHQAPHYFNAEKGTVEELPIPGSFPFGVSKLGKYQEVEVALHSGDVLVFYTDGVTEAANPGGEMFYQIDAGPDGQELVRDRLAEVMAIHHAAPAQEIHDRILRAVTAWVDGGPQADDITLVVVKVA